MSTHRERRAAAYLARGMTAKAAIARSADNNRSKRARGKRRGAVKWHWRGQPGARFAEVRRCGMLCYGPAGGRS
jgi:hypothetical protein